MAGRVIGGICCALGVILSLVTLLPITVLSWKMWNGDAPDMIMVAGGDGPTFSAGQFLALCSVVLLAGLVLIGVGVQFLFRSGRRD
jgi:hypothetical protein